MTPGVISSVVGAVVIAEVHLNTKLLVQIVPNLEPLTLFASLRAIWK